VLFERDVSRNVDARERPRPRRLPAAWISFILHFNGEKCKNADMDNLSLSPQHCLSVGGASYRIVDLPALFGVQLRSLPVVLRLVLENVIRNTEGSGAG
jgi:aconitate hydratase